MSKKTKPFYKATVRITGMKEQHVYGHDFAKLQERAAKLLTEYQPGDGGFTPVDYQIFTRVGRCSGPDAKWQLCSSTPYRAIPLVKQEWRRRRAVRVATNEGVVDVTGKSHREIAEVVNATIFSAEELIDRAGRWINAALRQTKGGKIGGAVLYEALNGAKAELDKALEKLQDDARENEH